MDMADLADAPTIVHRFLQRATQDPHRVALHVKVDGRFRGFTWQQLADDVFRTVWRLAALGIHPGDHVAHLGENSYEWIVVDLAIQLIRAVHVPLHVSLADEQLLQLLQHSEARIVLISSPLQRAELARESLRRRAGLRIVPCGERCRTGTDRASSGLGRSLPPEAVVAAQQLSGDAQQHLTADSLATILYTSGTTGEPRAVMLTQGNLVYAALGTITMKELTPLDLRLIFLPLSHIFERSCGVYTWICAGSQLALAERRDTVLEDCASVSPTVINGVPYFFQQLRRQLQQQGRADDPAALRQLLGGRIRCCNSGGAPLPEDLFDFYQQRGVPLLQGYGLTEASPVVATSSPRQNRRGSVGRPLPGTEVRIANDGEILTRGPHVMLGYWRDPQATAQVLRDGWLHTGDLGRVDADGFLWVTGRKRELIVLSVGKNVAPTHLESLLTTDPLIEQAMIVGNGRSHLAALIVPHRTRLEKELPAELRGHDHAERLGHPQVQQLFRQRIDHCLSSLSHHEQVRRFALLERSFTLERGELTPKLSLRRSAIAQHFADQIEAMYRPG